MLLIFFGFVRFTCFSGVYLSAQSNFALAQFENGLFQDEYHSRVPSNIRMVTREEVGL